MKNENYCAFVRQSWYETARKHLNDAERLALYEAAFNLQFYNTPPENLVGMVSMLFDIIRPTIEQDREKMEKRRLIARENGRAGGRPANNTNEQLVTKPSGLNENPVGFFGLANTIYNNTNTNTNYNVCSNDTRGDENEQGDTHTKFLVVKEFYFDGVPDPIAEGAKFWNYYEARGWTAGDGQAVKNRLALAKSWHPKEYNHTLAKRRHDLEGFFNFIEFDDFNVFERINAAEIDNTTQIVKLFVKTKENAVYLEERHINGLSKWVKDPKTHSNEWQLDYIFSE